MLFLPILLVPACSLVNCDVKNIGPGPGRPRKIDLATSTPEAAIFFLPLALYPGAAARGRQMPFCSGPKCARATPRSLEDKPLAHGPRKWLGGAGDGQQSMAGVFSFGALSFWICGGGGPSAGSEMRWRRGAFRRRSSGGQATIRSDRPSAPSSALQLGIRAHDSLQDIQKSRIEVAKANCLSQEKIQRARRCTTTRAPLVVPHAPGQHPDGSDSSPSSSISAYRATGAPDRLDPVRSVPRLLLPLNGDEMRLHPAQVVLELRVRPPDLDALYLGWL